MKKLTLFFLLIIMLLPVAASAESAVYNGSFEMYEEGQPPVGWYSEGYADGGERFSVSLDGFDGTACAKLENLVPNDARITQKITCHAGKYYVLSARVKTENVISSQSAAGASICVQPVGDDYGSCLTTSEQVDDTSAQWQTVTLYVETGTGITELYLWLRLGGYGADNTGTAYFDDVTFEEISALPQSASAVLIGKKGANLGAVYLAAALLLFALAVYIIARVCAKKESKPKAQPASRGDEDSDDI